MAIHLVRLNVQWGLSVNYNVMCGHSLDLGSGLALDCVGVGWSAFGELRGGLWFSVVMAILLIRMNVPWGLSVNYNVMCGHILGLGSGLALDFGGGG